MVRQGDIMRGRERGETDEKEGYRENERGRDLHSVMKKVSIVMTEVCPLNM